jgi:putative ABC transport system substrate-binding protein
VNSLDEANSKFGELAGGGDAGIIISTDSTLIEWRSSLMDLALKHRLISGCPQARVWAEAGCLVTYTEDRPAQVRGVGAQVVKVLKGAKPADIPVELPSSGYKLVVNSKTAKALGLNLPSSLLVMADEIIE